METLGGALGVWMQGWGSWWPCAQSWAGPGLLRGIPGASVPLWSSARRPGCSGPRPLGQARSPPLALVGHWASPHHGSQDTRQDSRLGCEETTYPSPPGPTAPARLSCGGGGQVSCADGHRQVSENVSGMRWPAEPWAHVPGGRPALELASSRMATSLEAGMCKRSPGCEEVAPGLSGKSLLGSILEHPRPTEHCPSLTLDGSPPSHRQEIGEHGRGQARTARQRGAGLLGWT